MRARRPDARSPRAAAAAPLLIAFLGAVSCGGGGSGGGGGGPVGVTVATASLPPATPGRPYEAFLAATGGAGGYAWSLVGGGLPSGISIDPAGRLFGTTTSIGSYPVTVRATDGAAPAASGTRALVLAVGLEVGGLTAEPGATSGTVTLRFTAPSAVAGPVTAYVVRASVPLILSDANRLAAPIVPLVGAPGAPGASEVFGLTGLEAGRTLQFAVQPVVGGVESPFTYAVASRVTGGPPVPPGGAIPLAAAGTISAPGTYVLTADVSVAGTAFTITSGGVTLDLGGHTVTYGTGAGTAHGVRAVQPGGALLVRNGTIVQGGGSGASCHGVVATDLPSVRLAWLSVTVHGTDADGISVANVSGDVRVDHCTVACDTTVVTNRHFPGVAAIRVDGADGSAEIDQNLVLSTPQWGIRLQGGASAGPVRLHHCRVLGAHARVANAYGIGVYKRDADVFENEVAGEGRGIHVASDGSDGIDCRIHDNRVAVQDFLNPEFPDFHWCHGIKVEAARGAKVIDNAVTVTADAAHAAAYALDVSFQNSAGDATGIEVRRNLLRAIATDATYPAHAIQWSEGAAGASNDAVFRHDVLVATDRLLQQAWDGGRAAALRDCVFVRDLSQGGAHPFAFEEQGNGGGAATGMRVVDPVTALDPLSIVQYGAALPFDTSRDGTLVVRVAGPADAPLSGALVVVKDVGGATVLSTLSDGFGLARATLLTTRVVNGPAFDARTPHTVTVSKSGFPTHVAGVAVAGRTVLRVDLSANTSGPDAAAPAAPGDVVANPVSASRTLLRWTPVADASGVVAYLVSLDGTVVGITDEARFVVPGLAPSSAHVLSVAAVDAAGGVGPAAAAASVATRAEDRGP